MTKRINKGPKLFLWYLRFWCSKLFFLIIVQCLIQLIKRSEFRRLLLPSGYFMKIKPGFDQFLIYIFFSILTSIRFRTYPAGLTYLDIVCTCVSRSRVQIFKVVWNYFFKDWTPVTWGGVGGMWLKSKTELFSFTSTYIN